VPLSRARPSDRRWIDVPDQRAEEPLLASDGAGDLRCRLVAGAKRGELFDAPFKSLLQVGSLPKVMTVPPVNGADAGVVGTASDYRLRYHLGACSTGRFMARGGAAYVTGIVPLACSQFDWFFTNLDELTMALMPAGRHLDDGAEQLLSSYCVVLALLDAVFRSGGRWIPKLRPTNAARRTRSHS
jgi:hypothetical protein